MSGQLFECHITIEPITDEYLYDKVVNVVTRYGFIIATLVMVKGINNPRKDAFMTAHSGYYTLMHDKMVACCQHLQELGIKVYRAKIEEIIFDTRTGDKINGLQIHKPA